MKLNYLFITMTLFFFTACQKDNTIITTPTPCPPVPVVKTPEQLITAKTWKADEVRSQLSSGSTQYYKRGGSSNTANYDTDSLSFNTNNSGIYYFGGLQYSTTWNFTNTEKSKITMTINYPSPLTVYWENVTLTETYVSYSQYITSGPTYLASVRRLPN